MKHLFGGLMALGVLVGLAADAKAQPTYNFTTIDVPGSDATSARGINALGQIVGTYQDAAGTIHSFLLDQGNYTTLGVRGDTFPWGINDSGQIVGWYDFFSGFLLDQGNYTTLDLPGSTDTGAYGINDLGQIVGWYHDGTRGHGFLFDHANYTTLDPPGSSYTYVTGINASGQIVGFSGPNDWTGSGFLLDQGSYTALDVPASDYTEVHGINDSGQIVGITAMLAGYSTASCSIRAATPRSTCPGHTTPMPPGSTTRAKSWGITSMLTA